MKRMKILSLLLAVTSIVSLAACSPPQETSSETKKTTESTESTSTSSESSKEMVTMRTGAISATSGLALEYGLQQGWFEEAGINIERVVFPNGVVINEAIAADQLDIACNGLASVYSVATGEVTWIGELTNNAGLSVYVRPDNPVLDGKCDDPDAPNVYGSAESMKGLEILGPVGSSSQFNAITWYEKFGLTSNDFKMLHMEYNPALQAFLAGEGDAIAACPPYSYILEDAGMVSAAPLSETCGFELMDGIIVVNDYYEENHDAVVDFVKIICKAQEELASNPQLFFDLGFTYYNENGREYDEDTMWTEVGERKFADTAFYEKYSKQFGATLVEMGKFYVNDGKIDPDIYPNITDGGIDISIMEEIYDIDFSVYGE